MGLEELINKIILDAKKDAEAKITLAESEKAKYIAEAKSTAERMLQEYEEVAKKDAKVIYDKLVQSAKLNARNKLLTEKQKFINKLLQDAINTICNFSEEKYFQWLEKQLELIELPENYELILCQRDLDRLPKEWRDKKISKEVRNISGGFVIKTQIYELNNTLEAKVEHKRELLEKVAYENLFK